MRLNSRPAYTGTSRALVIAIDFGTTCSGVAYAILDPGQVSSIQSVTCYPGQEDQASKTKVPSILLYDCQGKVRARGAEIYDPETEFLAQEEDWIRVEWLKLLFRPEEQKLVDAPEPQLPSGKNAVEVLGEYLQYLQHATRDYIRKTHVEIGTDLWEDIAHDAIYILSHPNGWDGSQQSQLRNAAILGGLIPPTDAGRARVRFVSEGEASFHWCVESGLAAGAIRVGADIIVADAGGGTVDVSSFRITNMEPRQIEETKPAECRLAGSVFVNDAFHTYLNDLLAGSSYDNPETMTRISDGFEQKVKPLFRDRSRRAFIPFGVRADHNPSLNIQSGQLVLSGDALAGFFEPSCQALVDAITAQISPGCPTIIFLVGGFAANTWLYNEVQNRLLGQQVIVKRADDHVVKAVAEGAVGYYLDHYVTARVAKFTYGVFCFPKFDPKDKEHTEKRRQSCPTDAGDSLVSGRFIAHVYKGAVVQESAVHRIKGTERRPTCEPFECEFPLICYRGNRVDIRWRDEDPINFRTVCTFKATLPPSCGHRTIGRNGTEYYRFDISAVVTFGTAEFACHIEWENKGEVQRGPATLVWDEG